VHHYQQKINIIWVMQSYYIVRTSVLRCLSVYPDLYILSVCSLQTIFSWFV